MYMFYIGLAWYMPRTTNAYTMENSKIPVTPGVQVISRQSELMLHHITWVSGAHWEGIVSRLQDLGF